MEHLPGKEGVGSGPHGSNAGDPLEQAVRGPKRLRVQQVVLRWGQVLGTKRALRRPPALEAPDLTRFSA